MVGLDSFGGILVSLLLKYDALACITRLSLAAHYYALILILAPRML